MSTSDQSVKRTRVQGSSCDASRFRKIRCDRRAKIEQKGPNDDESQIACTVCSQHGLRCTFTQSAPRRRKGRRIMAIQKSQLDDIDDKLAERSLEVESQNASGDLLDDSGARFLKIGESEGLPFGVFGEVDANNAQAPSNAGQTADRIRARGAQPSSSAGTSASAAKQAALIKQGLFGVRGLTRALLDACVRAYFKYAAPCMPILHIEVFSARYSLFFAFFEANNGVILDWKDLPLEPHEDMPLSVLLILAVGCVGAALLEPPIAEPGSVAKFRLQDRIALRFQEYLKEKDTITRLKEEGADVIEACYIMSDPSLAVLGDDQKERQIDFEDLIRAPIANRQFLDPLKMSHSTPEAVVRMIFAMGINRRPKPRLDCPPGDPRTWLGGGVPITQSEVFRRVRIFFSTFMQDSFRSMGKRKRTMIDADDYDLDLPRIIPRRDGFFSAMLLYSGSEGDGARSKMNSMSGESLRNYSPYNAPQGVQGKDHPGPDPQPASVYLQPARFARFDALQLEVMLRLAFIVRTVSIRFVSPRAQGRGVLITDVERATSSLNAWFEQLPADVTWQVQAEPLLRSMREGKEGSNNAIALRNSIKSLFVEMLFHGNVLAVWAALSDFGVRFDVDLTEAVHLFATRMSLDTKANDANRTGILNMLEGRNEEQDRDARKQSAREGMDRLAARSLRLSAKLVKEAGMAGLMRANRSVLMNISSSYAVWACDLARRIVQTGNNFGLAAAPGQDPALLALSYASDLLFGISTMDSSEAAPGLVKQIGGLMEKSQSFVVGCRLNSPMHGSDFPGAAPRHDSNESNSSGDFGPRDSISPRGASSATSEESNQQKAANQPFHFFYSKGAKRDLGDTVRDFTDKYPSAAQPPSTFQSPSESTSSHSTSMDADEVVMLARAALPKNHEGAIGSTGGAAQSRQYGGSWYSPGNRPAQASSSPAEPNMFPQQTSNMTALYGPALDLNLESIAGMDTGWLVDYLRKGEAPPGAAAGNAPPGASAPYTYNQGVGSTHGNFAPVPAQVNVPLQASVGPTTNVMGPPSNSVPMKQEFGLPVLDGSIEAPNDGVRPMTVEQAATQAAGLDVQWDQLMAHAGGDAQLWAENQWQGFSFASPPQS